MVIKIDRREHNRRIREDYEKLTDLTTCLGYKITGHNRPRSLTLEGGIEVDLCFKYYSVTANREEHYDLGLRLAEMYEKTVGREFEFIKDDDEKEEMLLELLKEPSPTLGILDEKEIDELLKQAEEE